METLFLISENQKKKSNQDDSDEDDDDDDEAGPSNQQAAAVQPQAGYAAPMAQLGMPPVAGAPGMHPGGYQGKDLQTQARQQPDHIWRSQKYPNNLVGHLYSIC